MFAIGYLVHAVDTAADARRATEENAALNGVAVTVLGRDLDAVTGKRCTFAFFPWNWDRGDGCIIRLVAITDPSQTYRIEKGEAF